MKLLVVLGLAVVLGAAAFAAAGRGGGGATYYVSPTGHDAASGAAGHPWRTVARVDRARLGAGDRVLFEGGNRYRGQLVPPGSHLTFASYGGGLATIAGGIWFASRDHLTFRGLAVTGADVAGLGSSGRGSGATHVTVDSCLFARVRIGINSANTEDRDWTVTRTTIRHTRDSGVIVVGGHMKFTHDAILDTGEDSSIGYARHGVYAKGPSLEFDHVLVRRFSTDGISLRFRDATVTDSTIAGGEIGIAFFQEDARAGDTVIRGNHISGTSAAGIYISPSDSAGRTRESFLITGNTAGRIEAHTTGHLTLHGNS